MTAVVNEKPQGLLTTDCVFNWYTQLTGDNHNT